MIRMISRLSLAAIALLSLTSFASANDELYGKAIPIDAAFVRALGFAATETPTAFGQPLPANGDYAVILPNSVNGVLAKQVYTLTPSGLILHDPQSDRAKVQIALFNADIDGELTLKTADGKVAIASAPRGGAGFREVNPLVVPAAVFAGDQQVGDAFDLTLVRGENPTIWVSSAGVRVLVSGVLWEE